MRNFGLRVTSFLVAASNTIKSEILRHNSGGKKRQRRGWILPSLTVNCKSLGKGFQYLFVIDAQDLCYGFSQQSSFSW